jgi:NADH-quinone oxidoreductase subunit J
VHCALFLAAIMLSLAVYYAMQSAPFLAFVQVIVYTGAVLMLFLFVMMLIGVSSRESLVETIRGQRLAAAIAGIALAVLLIVAIGHAAIGPATQSVTNGSTGNITGLATLIFTTYVFPFEVTSALLITAALGAMVLAHRERLTPKLTQRDLAQQRVASGSWVTTAPRCCRRCPRSPAGPDPILTSRLAVSPVTASRSKPPRREGPTHEPVSVRDAVCDPVRHRRGRRPGAAQRHHRVHVHRTDAERGQPGLRGVFPYARQPGWPGNCVLRHGGGRG